MNVRCVFYLILVTKKLIIEVCLMTLSIKNGEYAFLITLDLMLSMSRVQVVTIFKLPIYQTFN